MKELSEVEIGWLAGLLEGEGSFMMSRNIVNGKLYHYPKIVVCMTDEDVIQRAADMFETSVYKVPPDKRLSNRKQQWKAQINGAKAAILMSNLLPHMGHRRSKKISEILDQYGELESTAVRRSKNCSNSAKKRWAMYGTRYGKLPPND